MRARSMAVVAVIGMVLAACGGTSPDAAGPSEGIQVHGDWTIEVYNEDGALDERREFSNALAEDGANLLAGLLRGDLFTDYWYLMLSGSANVCGSSTGAPAACRIDERQLEPDTGSVFYNLSTGGAGTGEMVMTGSLQASNDGDISNVQSITLACPELTEGRCLATNAALADFTETDLPPVSIQAGQIVQVEVVISFTTG